MKSFHPHWSTDSSSSSTVYWTIVIFINEILHERLMEYERVEVEVTFRDDNNVKSTVCVCVGRKTISE
jgi:hypothetical protein